MSSAMIQLIVLAGIAVFLIMRLKNVLGTRDGFEGQPHDHPEEKARENANRRDFEVIEGGIDRDIADHVEIDSAMGKAFAEMKRAEPSFNLTEFLNGARGAYEMILMAFENGDRDVLRQFLSDDVYASFTSVLEAREKDGLKVEADFTGLRELKLKDATFDRNSSEGEITMAFVGELTSVVKDRSGEIVEGNPDEVKKQKDIWSFARIMGSNDPNWQLVATGG